MALRWADKTVEESTSTTTGAYQLGGVPSGEAAGSQTFVAGIGDGNTCYYEAEEVGGSAYERGIGTVADASPDTLTRTTIHASSNGGAAVDWTGMTVRIMCVMPAYAVRRATLDHAGLVENLTLSASRSGNAETIAVKTRAGADPSAADPVRVAFAKSDGGFEVLEITSALSLTISSGSTLGAANGAPFRVWVVLFNDAGTFRLGAIKCALSDGVYGLQDNVLESSTAEGGAGAADSSGVIYTGTAVTSKAMRVLGYLEYTLTTAGTWDTAPSIINIYAHGDRLPGEIVQTRRATTSARTNVTVSTPALDDSIPQNTEGVEILTQSVTPRSAASLMRVSAHTCGLVDGATSMTLALYRDSVANALAAAVSTTAAGNGYALEGAIGVSEQSPGTSEVIYKLRIGKTSGNIYINGSNSTTRIFGGVAATWLQIEEIAT